MSLRDNDYLMRSIRQLASAIASLLGKKAPEHVAEARRVAGEAGRGQFGPLWSTLLAQNAETAVALFGDRDKAEVFASIVEQVALVEAAAGNEALARARRGLAEGVRARLGGGG